MGAIVGVEAIVGRVSRLRTAVARRAKAEGVTTVVSGLNGANTLGYCALPASFKLPYVLGYISGGAYTVKTMPSLTLAREETASLDISKAAAWVYCPLIC